MIADGAGTEDAEVEPPLEVPCWAEVLLGVAEVDEVGVTESTIELGDGLLYDTEYMGTDSVHGKTHTLPSVVSCAAVVAVGAEYGVDVVGVIEELSDEDGMDKAVVVEDFVEEDLVNGEVVEDLVEEAVVDVLGGAA